MFEGRVWDLVEITLREFREEAETWPSWVLRSGYVNGIQDLSKRFFSLQNDTPYQSNDNLATDIAGFPLLRNAYLLPPTKSVRKSRKELQSSRRDGVSAVQNHLRGVLDEFDETKILAVQYGEHWGDYCDLIQFWHDEGRPRIINMTLRWQHFGDYNLPRGINLNPEETHSITVLSHGPLAVPASEPLPAYTAQRRALERTILVPR